MDPNSIITIVGSLGFPIAACIGIFWYMTQVVSRRDDKTAEAIEKMTQVVVENNKIITILSTKLDILFKYIGDENVSRETLKEEKGDDLR